VDAYWRYFDHRGCPTFLHATPLSPNCIADLASLYNGEARSYGLAWIGRLRHEHELNHCPFCGSIFTCQLEHYAPREVFPEYMVLSWNLVPTCSLCNGRRNHHQNNPGAWHPLFHPYFEDLLHVHSLLAVDRKVINGDAVFTYDVKNTDRLPKYVLERVLNHYAVCIHEEQFNSAIRREWRRALVAYRENITLPLDDFLASRENETMSGIGCNSWHTALYRTLRHSTALQSQFVCEASTPETPQSYEVTRYSFTQPAYFVS